MSQIVPDTKDWTWVLDRPCPDCGLDAREITPTTVGPAVRAAIPRYVAALASDDVTARPDPATWSVLEYAAHVRDVFGVFEERLALILTQDSPTFPNWDQDAAAVAGRYDAQDPQAVGGDLTAAGLRTASAFDAVEPGQWDRAGLRSNGSAFTVHTLGQYFVHDVVHHLHDIGAD